MEARDRERLKTELNHGVRLAKSLGLDVSRRRAAVLLDPQSRLKADLQVTAQRDPAALEVGAEEVLGAGGRHRGRGADLERERRRGDDLREAVDLAGAVAAHDARATRARSAASCRRRRCRPRGPGSGSTRAGRPRRAARCRAPSSSCPTMPRSWPVAAKIAAIADAGVNATDCMPDATAPCVPAHESASRSAAVVRSTREIASSVSVASAITVLPWPDWKNSNDGFLSPPMFASSIDALDRHRRVRQHVRHVQRVRVARHHVRPDGVARRPAPEHVAHRPDDVRLRLAQHGVARQLGDVGRAQELAHLVDVLADPARERRARRRRPCRRSTTRA